MTDDKELVVRLRKLVIMDEVSSDNPLGRDAADLIERLSEEVGSVKTQYAAYRELVQEAMDQAAKDKAEVERLKPANNVMIRDLDYEKREVKYWDDAYCRLAAQYAELAKEFSAQTKEVERLKGALTRILDFIGSKEWSKPDHALNDVITVVHKALRGEE